MQTLISFDVAGDFGFFRKPDTNDGIQLSYNLIHKPSVLGILGAIAGLAGYRQAGVWPQYYECLKHLRIGIEPLGEHERGNFGKVVITYTNTVGYANDRSNLIVRESTLLNPGYRLYLLLDTDNPLEAQLLEYIQTGKAVYLPYFGKNECPLYWSVDDVKTYEYSDFKPESGFKIRTAFVKNKRAAAAQRKAEGAFARTLEPGSFAYFEEIPIGFWEELHQYDMAEVAYSNWMLSPNTDLEGLYEVVHHGDRFIIQLF